MYRFFKTVYASKTSTEEDTVHNFLNRRCDNYYSIKKLVNTLVKLCIQYDNC